MKATDVQRRLIHQVTDALQAEAYRVTLMKGGAGFNLTRPEPDAPEQPLGARELAEQAPTLARFNARGWNVYITPLSETHHYLVVDDLEGERGARFAEQGYRPALLQQTSPGNTQAVVRVPVGQDDAGTDERKVANQWVREVNQQYGDTKFSGAVHPFRLAGFTNRKDAYQQDNGHYPFVRLLSAVDQDCDRATTELGSIRDERARQQALQAPAAGSAGTSTPASVVDVREQLAAAVLQLWQRSDGGSSPDEAARQARPDLADAHDRARALVEDRVDRRGWVRDESRIDFQVATALTREGYAVPEVAQAIRLFSPGLEQRHRDADAYAERTASAAADHEAQRMRSRHGGFDIDR